MQYANTERKIRTLLRRKRLSKDLAPALAGLKKYYASVTIDFLVDLADYDPKKAKTKKYAEKLVKKKHKLRDRLMHWLRRNHYKVTRRATIKEAPYDRMTTKEDGRQVLAEDQPTIGMLRFETRYCKRVLHLADLSTETYGAPDQPSYKQRARARKLIINKMVSAGGFEPTDETYIIGRDPTGHEIDAMAYVDAVRELDFRMGL